MSELLKFNKKLDLFQNRISKEVKKIDKELSKRVYDKSDELDDYEIELEITFWLKEGDIEYKEHNDNILLTLNIYLKGIGTSKRENRRLFDSLELERKDILRIGHFWADIKVSYQYVEKL